MTDGNENIIKIERPRWWEDNVDEMFIGLVIGAIGCLSIYIMGVESLPVVNSAVTALGMYIAGKPRKNGNL